MSLFDRNVWAGICSVCKEPVSRADFEGFRHGCPGYMVDYSDETWLNPRQEPWKPGYRFRMEQDSQTTKGGNVHIRSRVYSVDYKISAEGALVWAGGVKPTAATQARAEKVYEMNRPAAPTFTRAQLERIIELHAGANDPDTVELVETARAMLADPRSSAQPGRTSDLSPNRGEPGEGK